MKLTYTLTLADYKAANALYLRQKFLRRLGVWIWPFLMLFAAVVHVLLRSTDHQELAADSLAAASGLLFISIFMPITRWWNLRRCFNQLFPAHRTDRKSYMEITSEGIVSTIPGVSEGKLYWSGVCAFAQDEKVTTIYLAPKRFLFFPTSALSPEQRAELNDLVARNGKGKKP